MVAFLATVSIGGVWSIWAPGMGTSELYRAVEALPEVLDSRVVDLEYLGRESCMPLFMVNREAMANPACLDWYVALARTRQ